MVSFGMVGTPRCGVRVRVQRTELWSLMGACIFRCAAERGADSAARCPCLLRFDDAVFQRRTDRGMEDYLNYMDYSPKCTLPT
jgi:hypothetical protein